ncbi:MAG: tRNA pseudouridine(38-40) synthase TruA [bacterium]|nr:tRNA pseudouridine(38-40) synthase TruA [bacterium]
MRNVRVEVAYDGSKFFGWQRQDGFESVQGAVEEALEGLVGDAVTVHGAGRTDTGVHALRQVAHFHVDTRLDDDRLRHAVNAHLARGVVVRRLESCRDDFHARFDARGKRYLYVTATTRFRPPFATEHVHWVTSALDLDAMRAAAAHIEGKHDFAAFGNAGSVRKTTVRTVRAVRIVARRERFAVIVEGDGFLYNMVRTIVGTLIEVGRGKLTADSVRAALESGDRTAAGPTAPARGLYLVRVHYDEAMFPGPDPGPSGVPGLYHH